MVQTIAFWAGGLSLALAFGTAGRAQVPEDAMEMQRCIWSCLYNAPGGATDPAYHACVARICDAGGEVSDDAGGTAATWQAGRTSDGRGHFAGLTDEVAGTRFFFMCGAPRQAILALSGSGMVMGEMFLDIDGDRHAVPVNGNESDTQFALIAPEHPALAALLVGSVLVIRDYDGAPVGTFPLTGAATAIRQAQASCG